MQPAENQEQVDYNQLAIRIAEAMGVGYVITNDVHYINKEDREIHGSYLNSKKGDRELGDFYESTYMKNSLEIYERMNSYLSDEQIDKLGGSLATINILTDYSLQKIKQYEKKIVHHP